MKTVFNYRNISIALFTLFAMALAPAIHATDDKNNTTVELKFIGIFRNQPVFELTLNNAGVEKEFTVVIRGASGTTLYKENISSNINSKKFLLNTEDIGNDVIRFEITGKKSNKTVVFEVNKNTRFVEETLVTRLNK